MKKCLVISASATVMLLSACAEQKKLDDMHDATMKMEKNTVEMNETTGKMSDTTSGMAKTTDKLAETTSGMAQTTAQMKDTTDALEKKTGQMKGMTDELYDALRQGNALQLRREAYESILKAPTLYKKISEAAKYFMSFELQLWNEYGQDQSLEKRDVLAQQAAMEFFLEIEELALRDGSVDPTATGDADDINSKENRAASFNAMAVAMHQTNRKQDRTLKTLSGTKKISMYSIMEEALLLPKTDVQKSGAAREVLAHEDRAIQLLQARYNVFQMIFIDSVSHIGDKNIFSKAKMALIGWNLNLDNVNPTLADYLTKEVLAQALSAKQLLIKLGHKPELDSTVARLLKKMKVKSSGKKSAAEIAQQVKIVGLLKELQK